LATAGTFAFFAGGDAFMGAAFLAGGGVFFGAVFLAGAAVTAAFLAGAFVGG
jgi:hypothetical protein